VNAEKEKQAELKIRKAVFNEIAVAAIFSVGSG